uniref:Protein Bel-2 n=1 Tax=Lygus hesperus TaxID=30085 RepID=A0A0A9XW54_LYGHE
MQAQERKRRESMQLAQGRQALKKKHLDLLREYHERQFFYWFERASERLQYMMHIPYISQSEIHEHVEKELNKYVTGSTQPYPLNFIGQLPLLEDKQGNVVEVHASLVTNHMSEGAETQTRVYEPPSSTTMSEEKLM